MNIRFASEMTTLEDIRYAVDRAASQVNSCAVAIARLDPDDRELGKKLITAWSALYDVEKALDERAAEQVSA